MLRFLVRLGNRTVLWPTVARRARRPLMARAFDSEHRVARSLALGFYGFAAVRRLMRGAPEAPSVRRLRPGQSLLVSTHRPRGGSR